MPNLRLSTLNAFDAATLTMSSELPSLPGTNMKKTARDVVWRSALATGPLTIFGTWNGNGYSLSHFCIFRHNGHGATIRLQLYSDAGGATQVYDSGTVNMQGVVAIDAFSWGVDPLGIVGSDPFVLESPYALYFTPIVASSFRITIDGNYGEGRPYFQASRMWLASYFEVAINPAFGAPLAWVDNTDRLRMMGGSLRTNQGARWRKLDLDFSWVPESDRSTWVDIAMRCQTAKDLVVSLFPAVGGRPERDYTINGKLATNDPINYANYAYRSKKLTIEEL